MKALRNLIALVAVGAMTAFLTGCGGDDNNNNNNNNNGGGNNGPQFAPATAAGFVGNTYTVTLQNGQTAQLTFPSATTYSLTPQGGAAETGTITGLNLQGEDWVATLAPDNAQGTARAGEIRAHFTAKAANTFTGTLTYQGANGPVTAPFTATVNNGGGTNGGGTNGGTNGGGTNGGGTNGGTNGGTTTGLAGKTLQLNYPGGGGEKFQFTSATAASYENGADTATYTYDTTTGALHIVRAGNGSTYDLVVGPGSNTGTTTVNYQEPGAPPTPSAASYTLQ